MSSALFLVSGFIMGLVGPGDAGQNEDEELESRVDAGEGWVGFGFGELVGEAEGGILMEISASSSSSSPSSPSPGSSEPPSSSFGGLEGTGVSGEAEL